MISEHHLQTRRTARYFTLGDAVSAPSGIWLVLHGYGQLAGEVARTGLRNFLAFMALFSINLAILNLLPIPVLDGGHLAFLAIEGGRGRPLSLAQRQRLTQVGFFVLVAIMVLALSNDVLRLFR